MNCKKPDIKKKQLSIDDNLYLLALVCTSNLETLKNVVINNQLNFEINFNFVFQVPVKNETNLIEEVSQLLELSDYFYNVSEFLQRNKLMKRLFRFYNIQKFHSNFMQQKNDDTHFTVADSYSPSVGSNDSGLADMKYDLEKDENINEIINISIANNRVFELTFLNIAIFLENYELIRFILRHSGGIGPMKPNQIHSLHLALYQNNNIILNMLLSKLTHDEIENGVINMLTDDRNYNPLQIAVYYGNEEALEIFYSHGIDINYDEQLVTNPLIWALENIEITCKIITCLLNLGANPNCIDKTHGYTPLIVAVLADRLDLVQLLLKYNADVNLIIDNPTACCALQVAIDRISHSNSYEIFSALLNAGANPTLYQNVKDPNRHVRNYGGPLIDAIAINSSYLLKKLLEFGANANTDSNGTYSPLSTACHLGRFEMVEILIKNKVDPVIKCKNSNTPLTIAISMVSNINKKLASYH